MFRINRDIRFSKDKSPYKTNFGGFIASGGKKSSHAGYYLHIENNHSFVGGGIYCPPSDVLKAVRKEIFYNPDKFKAIINDPVFIEHFKEIWDDNKLKKGPKDFPKDFPDLELLKFRNYTVGHYMSNDVVISSDFFGYAVERFKAMYSLNRFLNEAIDA